MSDPEFYAKIRDICYCRRTSPELLYRHEIVDGESKHIVFHEGSQRVHELKGESVEVWLALDGRTTVDEIVEKLCHNGRPRPEIIREVARCISHLGREGLIRAARRAKTKAP